MKKTADLLLKPEWPFVDVDKIDLTPVTCREE